MAALLRLRRDPRWPSEPYRPHDAPERPDRDRRAWLAAIPVAGVNAVAFWGQLAFLREHLAAPFGVKILVAAVLESVAIYLAWMAHLALAADDSALRLRLGAYGIGAVIGSMNYSHYAAPHWRPTATAMIFGLMSVLSPLLWSVHSRRASRDSLKARGLIEDHAVRLGATRWTFHPFRSLHVMFLASWIAENRPAEAIALIARDPRPVPEPAAAAPELPAAPGPAVPSAAPPALPEVPAARKVPAPRARTAAKPKPAGKPSDATGLDAALDEAERGLIGDLLKTAPALWPSAREYARTHADGSRFRAGRILRLAREEHDARHPEIGAVNGHRHGS